MMSNNISNIPLVSIACITYNQVKYIDDLINGFISQKTNFQFEILIHDDASTDGTAEKIKDYAAKYKDLIIPILQIENQWSRGVRRILTTFVYPKCNGKYIAICEGDDYWTDSYKLQKQVDFLESHPDYSFSHTSFKYLDHDSGTFQESKDESKIIKELQKRSSNDILENILLNNTYRIQTMTVMFRKELYNKIVESDKFLYESGYFMMGDTQVWVGLLLYGKLHYLEDNTAVYRIHNSSVCHTSDMEKKIRFQLSSYEMRAYLLSKHHLSRSLSYKIKKRYYITLWKYLNFNPEFSPKIKFWPVFIISRLMKNSLIRYFSKLIFENKYHIKIAR